jgi:phosphatidylserine/phosphatidylglycerophosphate/cardiolipin synthase-like enzyme
VFEHPTPPSRSRLRPRQVYVLTDGDYYHSLINNLRRANSFIYVAMYSMVYDPSDAFDWANDLIKELVNAKNRGVDIKVVIEFRTHHGYMNDNMEAYNYLSSSGVHVKLDQEADTDHLKLVVIDGKIVYVGSHNWSESALYYNREASVKIVSEEVARGSALT